MSETESKLFTLAKLGIKTIGIVMCFKFVHETIKAYFNRNPGDMVNVNINVITKEPVEIEKQIEESKKEEKVTVEDEDDLNNGDWM